MGLFSGLFGSADSGNALLMQGIKALEQVGVPDPKSMWVQIQNLVQQGVITPEELDTYTQGPSELGKVSLDPNVLQTQLKNLTQLSEIASAGGLDAIGKAKLQEVQDNLRATARGAQGAISEQARAMGVGGSNLDLVQQAIAAQGASNQAAKAGIDAAALAEQNRMAALGQIGTQGATVQGQITGLKTDAAKAQDAINAFNAANAQAVAEKNVAARNAAQATNLQEAQRVSDVNTLQANQEAQRRAALIQQEFENKYKKAAGIAGQFQAAGTNQAAASQADLAANAGMISGLLQGGATMGAAALAPAAVASDKNLKKDIKSEDKSLDAFMRELDPKSFKYKDKKDGEGKRYGVMAQDAEKSEVGKTMVKDTPHGKMLDGKATTSALLAAISRLAERVDELEGGK
jgi:hypothetical protein